MQAKLEDQHKLLQIAELDLKLATLHQKIKSLPEAIAHKEVTIQFETTRDLRIAAETELSDLSSEINRAESDVEQVAKRIEKDEQRLNAGQGTPKELEQIQHELVSLNARRAELEEVELEVMLRADEIKQRITDLSSKEGELTNQVAVATENRDKALAALENELQSTEASRLELLPQVDTALMDLYEKIRSNGIVAAARIKNGQCGGCNLAINSGDLNNLMGLPEAEVARCEECRCILVRS
ncbi:MAG: zinc ribbon domain-containing protein [Candidatus Nanopelagicaceae bacterium]